MPRGELRYSTPGNSLVQKALSWSIIAFSWMTAGIMIHLAVTREVSSLGSMPPILFWTMLPVVLVAMVYMPYLARTIILHPEFNIYSNGITMPMYSLRVSGKEGKFVPFNRIRAFRRLGRSQIAVYLSETKSIGYSHSRKRVINFLGTELRRKGVAEMPRHCPACKGKLFHYTRKCLHCGSLILEVRGTESGNG